MDTKWIPRAKRWTPEQREQLKIEAQNSRNFARILYAEKMDFYHALKSELAQKIVDASQKND